MILLIGTPISVLSGKPDQKTGEVFPIVQIQHKKSDLADSPIVIDNIKCKEPAQVAAFRAALGKTIKCPVQPWSTESGKGWWIEKGVLPTVVASAAAV